jgi:hypothetical protein
MCLIIKTLNLGEDSKQFFGEFFGEIFLDRNIDPRSQTYYHELPHQRCKNLQRN